MRTHKGLSFLFILLVSLLGYAQSDSIALIGDTSLFLPKYKVYPIEGDEFHLVPEDEYDIHLINPIHHPYQGFYQDLSTDGSPHKPINYRLGREYAYQPNIYSQYLFTKQNIRYYNLRDPFTRLFYSNTINNSRYFSVLHAQNIYDNLHLAIEYDVDFSRGSFDKSSTKNQFFNISSRYKDSSETYEALLAVVRNRAMQIESGGLVSDSLFLNNVYSTSNAYPVNLNSAYSKWKTFDIYLSQKYNFLNKSSNQYLKGHFLVHDLSYNTFTRIFHDSRPMDYFDIMYYSSTLTHDSLSSQVLENKISLSDGRFYSFGIKHSYLNFSDSINSESSNLITPSLSLGFGTKKLRLESYADYVVSSSRYNKDHSVGLSLSTEFDFLARHIISLGIEDISKEVDYFFTNYYSNNYQWNNSFEKIELLRADLGYSLVFDPSNSLSLSLDYFQIDNHTYIDETLKPVQSSQTQDLLEVSLRHNLRFSRLHLVGNYNLNLNQSDIIHQPLFQFKQRVAVSFFLFKRKLDTYMGVDFRYNTGYYADAYSSALGAFHLNTLMQVGNYLYTDIFIQAKISRVRLFLSLTHPYAGLFGYDYYQTPLYPQENLNLRFGLIWRFFD